MNRKLRRQLAKKLKESSMDRLQEYKTELETWAESSLETAGPRQVKRYRVALAMATEEIAHRSPVQEPVAKSKPVKRKPTGVTVERAEAGPSPFQVLGYKI